MKVLFIHQTFPGQFGHAARCLAGSGHEVTAIRQAGGASISGIRRIDYSPLWDSHAGLQAAREFEEASLNGLAVAQTCERLKASGFVPDLVIGHCGWGETLFVKDVWPKAPVLGYFEFYYRARDGDADFDPEFAIPQEDQRLLRLRNAVNWLALEASDWGQTPTRWQFSRYPATFRRRMTVAHEGVDTALIKPNADARVWLAGGVSLGADDEVITYCARNLEPYRGFHVFMRALPRILARAPRARALIVGGDGVSYGKPPEGLGSWREKLLAEVGSDLDLSRVHFLGAVPFAVYLSILQLSSAHVYLTYPFVLSWSLVEALSAGCYVIASNTPPVREVLRDGVNGRLFDFFAVEELADHVLEALEKPAKTLAARRAARQSAIRAFDLLTVCLPRQMSIWESLVGERLLKPNVK